MYVIDTNACTRLLNNPSLLSYSACTAATSATYICPPSSRPNSSTVLASARVSENLQLLERFSAPFTSLPFDDQCATASFARTSIPEGPPVTDEP